MQTAAADIVRWSDADRRLCDDRVAREEPLEIRVNGTPVAVVMRTPGHDEELALGFLVTERVVASAADVAGLRHCTVLPDADAEDNVLLVTLREGVALDLERLRRNVYANASCGICGKACIANVMTGAPNIADSAFRVSAEVLYMLPDRLRSAQAGFDATGGLHAAGLFDGRGEPIAVREDVGRHNAVDKLVGFAARAGKLPASDCILQVSGRTSFEIIQKAAAAGVPVVAAVSAPTSLAVSLARECGITLIGFLRGRAMNVYARPERVGP